MTRSSRWRGAAAVAVLFGPHAATALHAAAELAGADQPGLAVPVNVSALSLTAAGIWLLVRARHRSERGRAVWPAVCGAAGLALTGAVLLPLVGQTTDTAATVLLAGAGAWLCAGLATDTGTPLWRGRLAGEIALRWDMDAAAACAIVFAAHLIAMALDDRIELLQGTVVAQADAVDLSNPTLFTIQALVAGLREEIPLLALPAALMMAAHRPPWQILTVVCVLRVIPHAYLGATAPTSLVFAGAAWSMHRATGRIGPIIVGHTAFNATAVVLNHAEIGADGRRVVLGVAALLAGLLLSYAPTAAPTWMRHWLSKQPAPGDPPTKVKDPVR
ncbi:hypothetical protein [Actinomadura chibensis]|uniref:CPBP family intramembrane metalloprotease n=1 Tax=Actinomadura chibensis TaxID=392828 RepID=A0A5D0NUA5_9ACTN|nr:hypothetical protein [Actinomadura chibensis]TYB47812.1 hypothetical protein FXF69_00710 [Actinomadura chibensis]